ncbi:NAD-dependent epimerase/dehydratase family protein [bacterium]|nr:NAD-dependent epimerase/dehydratase family protein [bacterium]
MKILITGTAGFIGFSLAKFLLKKKYNIIGCDVQNNYYDVKLKKSRLNILKKNKKYFHFRKDLSKRQDIEKIFEKFKITAVIHLAAQPGVRYSITNPDAYVKSNLNSFVNLIDISAKKKIKNFIYASSSSVFGNQKKLPYSENDRTDFPESLYAATKKSNELIAHSYSSLYKMRTTGIRFFTIYGPWGRPDMAYFKFTKNILNNKIIEIYNKGEHSRDFTYIDDAVLGIYKILKIKSKNSKKLFDIVNIGNNKPEKLKKFVSILENILNKKAKKKYISFQKGDVKKTHASIKYLTKNFKFKPKTDLTTGLKKFVNWYKTYYNIK